jgi:adenylate cyclase
MRRTSSRRSVFQVRIGINLGEVIVEGEDRYGEGVNIAARLEELAEPSGSYVCGKASKEVEKKLAFAFEPLGERRVKNVAEPLQVYRVKLDAISVKRLVPVSRKRALPWAAAIVAVVATILGAAVIWFTVLRPTETRTTSTTIPSIAV